MGARAAEGLTVDAEAAAAMLDVAFAVSGAGVPRDYRRPLAAALTALLPWLGRVPGSGVHRLNLSAGTATLLSRRTRLTLRVPRERADEAAALAGRTLALGEGPLALGEAHARELLPHGTLYAHLVADEDGEDELAFLARVERELAALGVAGRAICGRHHQIDGGRLQGYGLLLDRLAPAHSLRVLETGLGRHRELGCGLFVPHKSAAAVGADP